MAAAVRALPPLPRHSHNVYSRVLHAHTHPGELRKLLNREWATISVVAGLVYLLAGESAVAGPFRGADSTSAVNSGAGYAFLAANMLAYVSSATSCLTALLLLHASNAVPQGQLHAFLRSVHAYLWLPLVCLFISIVATAVTNACAALIIYSSWAAFGARLGFSLVWLIGLACVLIKLSRSAVQNSMQGEAQAAAAGREAGGGGRGGGGGATAA